MIKRVVVFLLLFCFMNVSFAKVISHLSGDWSRQYALVEIYLEKIVKKYNLQKHNIEIIISLDDSNPDDAVAFCISESKCKIVFRKMFLYVLQDNDPALVHALYHEIYHIMTPGFTGKNAELKADKFGMNEAIFFGMSKKRICEHWRYRYEAMGDFTGITHPQNSVRLQNMGCKGE